LHFDPAAIPIISQPVKALHSQHIMNLAFWQLNHSLEVGIQTIEIELPQQ
jgi:hypothetical protein